MNNSSKLGSGITSSRMKVFAAMAALGLTVSLTGCLVDGDTASTNARATPIQPTGTVQGKLIDSVTQQPIVGAVIDIGVGSATTNASGQFVIANVPANTDALNGTVEGEYQATIDLRSVTSPVNMATATAGRYPDFSYDGVTVAYTSLNDTDANDDNSSNTNGDTPVTGLVANVGFDVGKLAAGIKGVVAYGDDSTNQREQPVPAGWTVKLVSNEGCDNNSTTSCENRVLGSTTTDAAGAFTFANVESKAEVCIQAWNPTDTFSTKDGGRCLTTPTDNETISLNVQPRNGDQNAAAVYIFNKDNLPPVVINVTPENNVDIAPTGPLSVVFTFSEAIRQDAYATALTEAASTANGGLYQHVSVNFLGTKAGNIAHSLSWSADFKQLTVTIPTLAAASKYSVDISAATLKDLNGNGVTVSNFDSINFSTNGALAAAAPTVTITNSASLDDAGSPVLDWLPVSGAQFYNIYRAENVGGNNGALKLRADTGDSRYTETVSVNFVQSNETAVTYTYVVKSVNADQTESAASVAVIAKDNVAPDFTAAITGAAEITVSFNEPMNEVLAETAANYVLSRTVVPAALAITSAVYNTTTQSVILTTNGNLTTTLDTNILTVTGVTDIGGNANDTTPTGENADTF